MHNPVVRVSPQVIFLLEVFPNGVLCIGIHSPKDVQQQKKKEEEVTKITEYKPSVTQNTPGRKDKHQHVFNKPIRNINTVDIHIKPQRCK